MSYKDWKSNIKNLTEKLWEYWSASDRNEIGQKEILRKEFFEIFDNLEGPEENHHLVEEMLMIVTVLKPLDIQGI